MKPNVRIVYDRKKQATHSIPALVQIEVYYNRKKKYISTGVKVTIDKWDDANKRTKGTNNDSNNNYHINNLVRKIEDFIIDCERKGEEFSFTALDLTISGNASSSTPFLEYMLERLGKRKIEKGTAKTLMCLCNHVEKFGRLKTFADLTQTNIKEFDYYLSQCGMSPVTVAKRHKQLGSFINEAIIDGFVKTSPYATLKVQKGKSKEPIFLLENEIQMIANFETENRTIQKVKDVFLFQCFSGLAYSDVRKFTKDDAVIGKIKTTHRSGLYFPKT